jgi:predicted CXXCH cytochrome family protein
MNARATASARVIVMVAMTTIFGWGCDRDAGAPPPSSAAPATAPATTAPAAADAGVAGAAADSYVTPRGTKPTLFPVVAAAPRPAAPLPAGASCVTPECHAGLRNAPYIHGPVSEHACNACHADEDAGGHRYPLKREGSATCTFCHQVSGTAEHQHKALEQGCVSCHQPHTSTAKFLVRGDSIRATCESCHAPQPARIEHQPYARGECTDCHQPHESKFAGLLRGGAGREHCFSCHGDVKAALAKASSTHKPVGDGCGSCHGAHGAEFAHQLRKPPDKLCAGCHEPIAKRVAAATVKHSPVTDDKGCSNCHAPHASDATPLLTGRTDVVCFTCHDKPVRAADGRTIPEMKTLLTQSKFPHGPNRVGNCSACHDPHGQDNHALLAREYPKPFYASFDLGQYALCFTCHDPQLVLAERAEGLTNFRDGDVNLHARHVNRDKGRTCRACHEVHASDQPFHMAESVPFEKGTWLLPVGFTQTADGGTCASGCHEARTYRRGPANVRAAAVATTLPAAAEADRGVP